LEFFSFSWISLEFHSSYVTKVNGKIDGRIYLGIRQTQGDICHWLKTQASDLTISLFSFFFLFFLFFGGGWDLLSSQTNGDFNGSRSSRPQGLV